jgi:hypothetical protein
MFYLTPALGDGHDRMPSILSGPDSTRGDLPGRSGPDGSFALDAIPPGSYFLIVSAPGDWCEAIISEENPSPLLLTVQAGQRMALGVVPVRWP